MFDNADMKIIGLVLLAIVALAVAGAMDESEENLDRKHYCEMNDIFKNSGGEYGWPDFKGTYDKWCIPQSDWGR